MIRMLKILVIITLSSLACQGQIYIKSNNSYGSVQNRGRDDSTRLIPTYPVAPSGKAGLHSIDQKMSALYYDSTGHRFYVYDPSDSSWTKLGAIQLNDSMFKVGRDTITISGTGGGGGSADSVNFSTNYRRDTAIANVRAEKNFKLGWFNVKEFGAYGDSTHDDTGPIQNAINAAKAHKGGVVYFPNGFYRIGGAVISTVGGRPCHCQLYIPNSLSDSSITIEFVGESNQFELQAIGDVGVASKGGVIIESSLTSASAGDAIIAVVKGPGDDTFGKTNHTDPWFRNITFRTKRDGGSAFPLSGINARYASKVKMDQLRVDINVPAGNSPDPTGTGSYGIIMPEKSNHASVDVGTIRVCGYDIGVLLGEHSVIKDFQNVACNVGLVLTNSDHSASIQTFEGELNKTNIRVDGDMNLIISNYNTEHYNGILGAAWYEQVSDITFNTYTPYASKPGVITIGNSNIAISGVAGGSTALTTNDTSRVVRLDVGWLNHGVLLSAAPTASDDINVIKGLNDSTAISIIAGKTNSIDASVGAFMALRGNKYGAISSQRGNVHIGAGNPSSPASSEGTINFYTGNSINRLTIKNNGGINISGLATGVSGETRLLTTDVNGDIAISDPAIHKYSQNGATGFEVQNPSTGTSAEAYWALRNNVGYAAGELFGSNNSGDPAHYRMTTDAANGLAFVTASNSPIKFNTNSDGVSNERMRIANTGAILIGRTSLIGSELLSVNGKINANADSVGAATGGYLFRDAATGEFKIAPAGSSGITSINSQTGSAITVAGDQGNTVTQSSNTITVHSPYTLAYSDTSTTTVGNTTTETSLVGNVIGSTSITGSTITAGSKIIVKGYGIISTKASSPGNVNFNFTISNFTLGLNSNVPASLTNNAYEIEFEVTPFATGTSQDMFYKGTIKIYDNVGAVAYANSFNGKGAMTTTGTLSTDLTVQWVTADASNTVTSRSNTLEVYRLQ